MLLIGFLILDVLVLDFLRAVNMSYNGIDEQISLEVGPSVVEESSRKVLAG